MLRLYDFWESGNAYKVRLLLTQLGIPFECIPVDILRGETKTESYLEKNPNHRVPMLEWNDGRRLVESNAILFYLAQGTEYLSDDEWERGQTLQWMFFEQYSHEPYIAVVRFWNFSGTLEANKPALPEKMERGYHALGVMETHLLKHRFFVGERYSIADIALYAYTHVAQEGNFELSQFQAVQAWLERVRTQPRYIGISEPAGIGGTRS